MSSVAKFIRYPVETNPVTLAESVYAYIQARSPQWAPNETSLDVWIIQAITALVAENRELASDVPTDIFRWFGSSLIGLPPQDETPSTVTSTWTVIDNAGHTIPAGTQVGILDSAGNLVPFEVVSEVVIPPGSVATAAGGVLLRSIGNGAATAGLAGAAVALTLLDVLDFVTAVTATAATSGGVDAEDDDAYLDRLATHLRLLSTRPVLPPDFAVLAREVVGVERVVAIDGYNPAHNLLTADEASFETGVANYTGTNATLAQTAAQALDGTKSLQMTASSAADMSAALNAASQKAVVPGDTITVLASFRSAVTARSVKVGIAWYTAANALISTSFGGAVNDSAAAWTGVTATAIAPATAAFARIVYFVTAPANAELHYVDKASIRRGSTTDWVAGGTGETGQPRMIGIAGVDSLGANISAPLKTAVQNLLQANREVNFIVNVFDPNRDQVDVTYTAKALPGFSTATVLASINANLAAYLNAATWGNEVSGDPRDWIERTTVRYSDVAAIISNTEGVDYWTILTIGLHGNALAAADLPLPGPAALAILNTATGTVV